MSQKVTVREVVTHFCRKAYTTGRELEYTAEEIFEHALQQADLRDAELKECIKNGGNPDRDLGLFFGIPFSVKDQIYVKDTITSFGVESRATRRVDHDAICVQTLRKHGGIPFVKSNLAEACLGLITKNKIWGAAKHPLDKERTVGGSSGGDAGLLATG